MDFNFKRRAHEKAIATEAAIEICNRLLPTIDGVTVEELVKTNAELMIDIVTATCRRNGLDADAAVRVAKYMPSAMAAINRKVDEIGRRVENVTRRLEVAA